MRARSAGSRSAAVLRVACTSREERASLRRRFGRPTRPSIKSKSRLRRARRPGSPARPGRRPSPGERRDPRRACRPTCRRRAAVGTSTGRSRLAVAGRARSHGVAAGSGPGPARGRGRDRSRRAVGRGVELDADGHRHRRWRGRRPGRLHGGRRCRRRGQVGRQAARTPVWPMATGASAGAQGLGIIRRVHCLKIGPAARPSGHPSPRPWRSPAPPAAGAGASRAPSRLAGGSRRRL